MIRFYRTAYVSGLVLTTSLFPVTAFSQAMVSFPKMNSAGLLFAVESVVESVDQTGTTTTNSDKDNKLGDKGTGDKTTTDSNTTNTQGGTTSNSDQTDPYDTTAPQPVLLDTVREVAIDPMDDKSLSDAQWLAR